MNRKGSIEDILYMAIVFFSIAVIAIICFKVYNSFDTAIQTSDVIPNESKLVSTDMDSKFSGVFDNSMLILVVFIALAAFIMASLVVIHPIFFIPYLIFLIVLITLCGVFSNAYQELAYHPEFSDLASRLTITTHIMTWLPWLVGVLGMVIAVFMFKVRQG